MLKTCAIILAAGKGKRMKTESPKVLCKVLLKPMLFWVIDAIKEAKIKDICVVKGYKHQEIEKQLSLHRPFCKTVFQKDQNGTGHAVKMAKSFLKSFQGGNVLVLNGDAPFINSNTINEALNFHMEQKNAATVISSKLKNPFGYGRIVRNSQDDGIEAIIEQKDASESIQNINEINSGVYWFKVDALIDVLDKLSSNNVQGEYYLTDTVKLLLKQNKKVNAFLTKSSKIVLGANDCLQLYDLNQIAREDILNSFISKGVSIPCKDGIIIEPGVSLEKGTTLLPGTILSQNTVVGQNCVIGPNSQVINCKVENNAVINSSYCLNSNIINGKNIGPFACIVNKK